MSYHLLIDQDTGEIDELYLMQRAKDRACADHRSINPPPSWVREQETNLRNIALGLRAKRRAELGLPDDTVYHEMPIDLAAQLAAPGIQREV